MGEVYEARDTRLDRIVAIKVSREQFSQRFEREARSVAALNHPNICTLFDVGPNYLVMELIEGPTLDEQIKQGAIPLEESLNIAKHQYPPGFYHFPKDQEEYFKQLTAEQLVTRIVKGYRRTDWQKTRDRNESLDAHVYARAAALPCRHRSV